MYAEVHRMIINNNGFLSDFVEITSCVDAKTIILFHSDEQWLNIFTEPQSGEVNIPKATIHRDQRGKKIHKIREETIKKYDLIDESNHAKV